MRDNNAPFLASDVAPHFLATSFTIRSEDLTAPLPAREIKFLTGTVLGNADASRHTVVGAEVRAYAIGVASFLNSEYTQFQGLSEACHKAISARIFGVLRKLGASDGNIATEQTFTTLEVFKAGSHQLVYVFCPVLRFA